MIIYYGKESSWRQLYDADEKNIDMTCSSAIKLLSFKQ